MLNKIKTTKPIIFVILLSTSLISYAGGEHHDSHRHHDANKEDSHSEGIVLSDEAIKKAKIQLSTAGPRKIVLTKKMVGKIVPNANKTIYIYPRYNGLVKTLTKQLGESVKKNDVLSTIESNDSLQKYQVTAPFSGLIVKKLANVGEQVEVKSPIYQLSDLSTVWCNLYVYRKNARLIRKGQNVLVKDEGHTEKATISYVSPLGVEHNQTMLARVDLNNQSGTWLPGMYVQVFVDVGSKQVNIAVEEDAIQTVEGKPVVFVRTKEGFEVSPCHLGMKGKQFIEVDECLKPGQIYASKNSYLIKAHLEKEGASHEH
jgi:cobalt-zinc-cadmium efflux system membrane fusion protein